MPAELFDLKTLFPYFILIGAVTAWIAHSKRGRNPIPWFFLGFFFGCLAIISLFLLPKRSSMIITPATLPHSSTSISHTPLQNTPTILPMTTELWYFLTNAREQTGPVSFYGLKQSYHESKISKSSYVWNARLEEWKRLEELPEYLSLLEEPL